jgi:Flp pilus assembly protein TadG
MMRVFRRLLANAKGASAMEFGIAAPVFVLMIMGISQFGLVLFASTGLNNAIAEGARLATLYRPPTETVAEREAQIKQRVLDSRFGLTASQLTGPELDYGSSSDGAPYVEIAMSYTVPLDFGLFSLGPIVLDETRRVFVQTSGN